MLGNWGIHAHLTKGKVNLLRLNIFRAKISAVPTRHSWKFSQRRPIVTLVKGIGSNARQFPVLQIAEVILSRNSLRVDSHPYQTLDPQS